VVKDSRGLFEEIQKSLPADAEWIEVQLEDPQGKNFLDASSHPNFLESFQKLAISKPVQGLLFLRGFDQQTSFFDLDSPTREAEIQKGLLSLFYLCKQLLPDWISSNAKPFVLALTGRGGQFGQNQVQSIASAHAGVAGFLKCLKKENSNVFTRVFDCDPACSNSEIALEVQKQLLHDLGPVEMGFHKGDYYLLESVPELPDQSKWEDLSWDQKDVILVTGGARGVTAVCVQELAKQAGAHYVLLGRSSVDILNDYSFEPGVSQQDIQKVLFAEAKNKGEKPNPREMQGKAGKILSALEVQEQLQTLDKLGAKASYHSVDVTDRESICKLLKKVREEYGTIKSVIHGAGVLRDKRIEDKLPEHFDLVLDTKLRGLFNLLDELKSDPIELIALFSSVAGKFGNTGQSDYAAANEILSHLALQQDRPWENCRVISFNWGPFEGGMVTPELARHFASQGIDLIPLKIGAQLFASEILMQSTGAREIVVGGKNSLELSPDRKTLSKEVQLEISLDLEKSRLLQDHVLEQPVVPMALVLEICAQASKLVFPELHLHQIQNLKVRHGITFDEQTKVLDLRLKLLDDAEAPGLLVQIHENGKKGPSLSYEARVILGKHPIQGPVKKEVPKRASYTKEVAEAYDQFLFHGESLQCIDSISGLDQTGVLASLHTVDKKDCFEGSSDEWVTQPVLLDGMAQLGLIYLGETRGSIGIPQELANYTQYGDFQPGEYECELIVKEVNDKSFQCKIDFVLSQNDEVKATGEGWKAIFNESFNRFTTAAKRKSA